MAGRISAIAWLNVGINVAGLGLAAAFIRPGSALVSLPDRLAYLASDPVGWRIAWLVWAGCALAMVGFTLGVLGRIDSPLAPWAFVVAVVAALVDLVCDYTYIFEFP